MRPRLSFFFHPVFDKAFFMSEQPLSLEEAAARIKVKAPIAPIVQPQAETPIP